MRSIFKVLIYSIKFSRTEHFEVQHNMPLKVKIFHIYIYHLVYKLLYNMILNLDVAFVLSVIIYAANVKSRHVLDEKILE